MKLVHFLAALGALGALAACSDSSAPVKPAAIKIVAGDAQTAAAGAALGVAPTFLVTDASGSALGDVRVTIAVASGSGTIANAPTKTLSGATSVGTWTLGHAIGTNTLTVTVDGLAPLVISAQAKAGAPSKIVATTTTSLAARVGDVVAATPSVRVTDAFDNPVAGVVLNVAASGSSSAPTTATTDAQGIASISGWQVGTTAGTSTLTFSTGAISQQFSATVAPGDPVAITATGADQRGRAGATASPITVRVADKYGNAIANQTATFTVTAGGGKLASSTATSAADGSITIPSWTFGRSAVPQTVHVVAGTLTSDVSVTIASDFKIDVRFFGPAMTDAQKALFTNAAARISGIITGDILDQPVSNLNVATACGIPGLPTSMTETIDDVVIYASVSAIDGPGKILAEAGPCVMRTDANGGYAAVGVMLFDSADLDQVAASGMTQDVITHEMLHVVGIGTIWQSKGLLTAAGTVNVAYWGATARQGCVASGGATTCAVNTPVENNLVIGTSDSHWRESVFGNELMTGYVNTGGMPLSSVTVGSLADLGYVVNPLAADPYTLPGTGASGNLIPRTSTNGPWEMLTPSAVKLGASPFDPPTFIRRP